MKSEEIKPNIQNNIPECSYDECPQYDGKRCKLIGFQPCSICEIEVQRMAEKIAKLEGALRRLKSAIRGRAYMGASSVELGKMMDMINNALKKP